MDLRHLKYFCAIVEEGSFTRAALRLGVAQPALSQHVKRMEEHLGTALLLRMPTGVHPTEAGELLRRRAGAIVSDFDRLEEEVRGVGGVPRGTVRLGLPGTIGSILSVPLISRCRDLYPEIKLVIAEAMSGFVRSWLHEGRVDFAVVYTQVRDRLVTSDILLEEELVLISPSGAGAYGPLDLAHLNERDLVLSSGTHGLRILLDDALGPSGAKLRPAIEVDSYRSIMDLVAKGFGASVLPLHAVAADAADGRFEIAHFGPAPFRRAVYLEQLSARPMSRALGAVDGVLRELIRDLIEQGAWLGASIVESPAPPAQS